MRKTVARICATLILYFTGTILFAQEAEILEKTRKIRINNESGELLITELNHSSTRFLSNINEHTKELIRFSSLDTLTDFKAYTKVPGNKGRYKDVDVKVTEIKDAYQPGIFYGDNKRLEFVYPAVIPYSIGVLYYTRQIKDPHIIGSYFFDDQYEVSLSVFEVEVPHNVKIEYNLFNTEDIDVDFSIESGKDFDMYRWKTRSLKKRKYRPKSPSFIHFSPHIILRIGSYEKDGQQIQVSETTDDLFEWYSSLIEQMPLDDSKNILQEKVTELIAGLDEDEEKTRVIYQWVQDNIKYIAFEDGMAGFIPRSATDVFEKKYGDCKDMANLLKEMLDMAGIPAYRVWIGTNSKPYSYKEVPSTVADNHMICSIKKEGEYVFLDPTNSYLQYGNPPRLVQGKEALIQLDDKNYDIVTVPEFEASKNLRKDVLDLAIDGDVLKGEVNTTLNGYLTEEYQRAKLRNEYKNSSNFIQNYFIIGKNSSRYHDIIVEDGNAEIAVSFEGEFKNEIIDTPVKVYVNLNLDPSSEKFLVRTWKSGIRGSRKISDTPMSWCASSKFRKVSR